MSTFKSFVALGTADTKYFVGLVSILVQTFLYFVCVSSPPLPPPPLPTQISELIEIFPLFCLLLFYVTFSMEPIF
jgi:hypothetical protein